MAPQDPSLDGKIEHKVFQAKISQVTSPFLFQVSFQILLHEVCFQLQLHPFQFEHLEPAHNQNCSEAIKGLLTANPTPGTLPMSTF